MTNQITKVSLKTLKEFNAKQALQLQVHQRVSFQSKLCRKLGFESLKFTRWFRKLCTYFKIKTTGEPEYLFDIIPKTNHLYNTSLPEDVSTFYFRTDVFKYSFFSSEILEWNKLDKSIQQSTSMLSFRNAYQRLVDLPLNQFTIYMILMV